MAWISAPDPKTRVGVWNLVRTLAGMDLVQPRMHDIHMHLQPIAHRRTTKSAINIGFQDGLLSFQSLACLRALHGGRCEGRIFGGFLIEDTNVVCDCMLRGLLLCPKEYRWRRRIRGERFWILMCSCLVCGDLTTDVAARSLDIPNAEIVVDIPDGALAHFTIVIKHELDILNVLPFEEGKLPVKYLGVPLVSSSLIYRDCKELVEKVKSKINDWKNKFLSFAEQLMRGFIWCQGDMWKGRAKVAWNLIISLKESLWVKWIHVYKLRGRNFWDLPLSGNMSWGWRKILQVRPLIRQFIWYRLGEGNTVSAWFDRWCLLSPLSHLVTPRDIHRAGFNMASKVHDIVTNGSWKWPNEWRLKYPSLYTITVPSLVPNSLDQIVWKTRNDMDSGFSVATVWDCIRPRGAEIDWYNLVWFSHNIPRHSIHLWLVIQRKLKTQDKLRQWDVSSNTNLNLLQCPLCERQPDSHDHLFFECIFSLHVWHQVQSFTGVPNMPSSLDMIVNLLSPGARKRSARSIIVKLVFAAS
ncbi:hypothetical protein Tco_0561605 [Tanacetum coccineum]